MNPLSPPSPSSRKHSLLRLPLAITLAAGLLATAALSGCGEEPPPPPPPKKAPPPPPPPPPPEISIQALLQDAKADARVTFADNVKFTDENLARAVIALADGFARGDASKLKTVLDKGAVNVLNTLDASGEWAESTAGIEAVRVVYVGDAGDAFTPELDINAIGAKLMAGPVADALKEVPADKMPAVIEALRTLGTDATPETVGNIAKSLEDAGLDAALAKKIQDAATSASSAIAESMGAENAGAGMHFSRVVVIAVQDDKGAFLLGWGIGDQSEAVHFGNAPTAGVTKRRASDFDSIGLAAFGASKAASADAPAPEGEGETPKKPDEPGGMTNQPGNDPAPRDPNRKNTPGGPITIPGGG